MALDDRIESAIRTEAQKLIDRYHEYHNAVELEHTRKRKRMTGVAAKDIRTPDEWHANHLHNPFYVRRRARSIARSIARNISAGTFSPRSPFIRNVPKPGGGVRKVSVYQVPDAAVSNLFYKQLLDKNKHRFSSFSYAYRNDRNVHFAIQDIAIDLQASSRTFLAEFDFSDFFGSIDHDFLKAQLSCNGFMISRDDRQIINAFLTSHGAVGIPQGTSISLFLANMVCWELDKKLEKCGVKFARYADDTVIWSPDYAKICEAFECIDEFSREAGVRINAAKSAGISLLTSKGMPAEMVAKYRVDFLGYSLSTSTVAMKAANVRDVKAQISYILSKHLLQPLRKTPLRALVIPANDVDPALYSAIAEIRRYLYGGLTSTQIVNYIHGRTRRIYFKGLMSYYPLLTDSEQLKELDGWLVSAIHRAVRARGKLLEGHKYSRWHSFPFNVPRSQLIGEYRTRIVTGKRRYEVPSLSLLYGALSRALAEHGIERVMNPKSLSYGY
jgi:hypothetical protein